MSTQIAVTLRSRPPLILQSQLHLLCAQLTSLPILPDVKMLKLIVYPSWLWIHPCKYIPLALWLHKHTHTFPYSVHFVWLWGPGITRWVTTMPPPACIHTLISSCHHQRGNDVTDLSDDDCLRSRWDSAELIAVFLVWFQSLRGGAVWECGDTLTACKYMRWRRSKLLIHNVTLI